MNSTEILSAAMPEVSPAQAAAVQALAAAGLTPRQIHQALSIHTNVRLHATEQAKVHPLGASFSIPAADFTALIQHMQDGGGVLDDNSPLTSDGLGLGQLFWQSVLDANQAAFWPLLVELVKSWGRMRGRVQPVNGGGTIFSGVGRSKTGAPTASQGAPPAGS
jgi:hypothetical protein